MSRSVSTTAAVVSEQCLHPAARHLTDATPVGKALLARSTAPGFPTRRRIRLTPVVTEQEWSAYAAQRVVVEAGFGVGETEARAMVAAVRARTGHLGLDLYLACDEGTVVGAIGHFRMPEPHAHWARLQEVDVFPRWRGQGYGNAVLSAMLELLAAEGSRMVVVGADEDDWPVSWYRRRGFHDVARVPLTR